MFGSPETQPGGRALKFYSSQRLDIRRIETLKEGTEAVGNRVRVKVVKNKVARAVQAGRVRHRVRQGHLDRRAASSTSGIEHGVVTKSGSFFSYGDERLGQGRNNAKAYLNEHLEVAQGDRGEDLRRRSASTATRVARDRARRRHPAAMPDVAGGRRSVEPPSRARRVARDAADPRRRCSARSTSPSATSAAATARWPRCGGTWRPRAVRAGGDRRGGRRARRAGLPRRRAATRSGSPRTGATLDGWGAERIERKLARRSASTASTSRRRSRGRDRGARARRGGRAPAPPLPRAARRRPRARARARLARPQGLRPRARLRRGARADAREAALSGR